jgi:hypothetical protein
MQAPSLSLFLLVDKARSPEEIEFLKQLPKGYLEEVALKLQPGAGRGLWFVFGGPKVRMVHGKKKPE